MKKQHPNHEALKLKKQIERLENRASLLYGEASHLKYQMIDVCIHDETEEKYEYQPGGYLDREVYINKIVCKVCGKVLEEERKTGGFN